jgi:catechol 2,3-dioxygenase-like lactoylglutathione lyase family enzyme
MQATQLRHVIKFVADMDKTVKFHRDVLGLKVKLDTGMERVRDGRDHPRSAPRRPTRIRQA